ncbi:MAG: protein kinase [Eubacterium sp.]|nr:protein kinase [Eubacterium sp.]
MKEFNIPEGFEADSNCCPHCGFVENTKPRIINHLYPGTVLQDRYIIGVVIGSGGFGVTYKAWDTNLGITVAIKEHFPSGVVQRTPGTKLVIVTNKKQEYREGLNRFLDEARTLAKFNTVPEIVRAENYFEENNTAYLVMEYLDGVSLKEYLLDGNLIEVKDIEQIFYPVMNALESIHKEGIVHRDISPDNIFICNDGKIKVIDFGAARLSDEEKELTRSIVLKPGFAPAEQYASKSKQGPWTDVYALSATIYRSVTGETPEESTSRVVEDNVLAPNEIKPEISENLSNAIMKGMAIDARIRYRTIDEMRKAIGGDVKVNNPEDELKKRKMIRIISISAVAVLLLAAAGIVFYRYRSMKKAVDLEAAVITIWAFAEDEEAATKKEQTIKNMFAEFEDEYSDNGVSLEIKVFTADEYYDELAKVSGTADMPDLFESTGASEEILNGAEKIGDEAFKFIKINQTLFPDEMNSFKDEKRLPTGFYVPVVYVRRGNNVDIDNVVVSSIDELNNYHVDSKYIDLTAGTLGVGEASLADDNKTDEKAYSDFVDGDVSYYLASTNEFVDFKNDVAGRFEMRPYGCDSIKGCFSDYYSINASSPNSEKRAARVALSYMLTQSAQDEEHITSKNSIPLNSNSFDEMINSNVQYEIIKDYLDKLEIKE